MSLQTALRVYLDTADIILIADDKAPAEDVAHLHDVMERTGSVLIFSINHPWDYHLGTDAPTRHRMVEAFNGFPHVAAAYDEPEKLEPFVDMQKVPDLELGYVADLHSLMDTSTPTKRWGASSR